NPSHSLDLGMVVSLELRGAEGPRAPAGVVPLAGVVAEPGAQGYAVFVPEPHGGRTVARLRRVELGPALSENRVAVTGGIRPGEDVIISGAAMPHDGEEIRVQR